MKTFIIPTSQALHLAPKQSEFATGQAKNILARAKNFEIIFPNLSKDEKKYFPDGEIYIRISRAKKLKGGRVIVLHSGAPKPNEGLMELELILQILRDNRLKPEVIFTYFPNRM